jgi:hypothetical protein
MIKFIDSANGLHHLHDCEIIGIFTDRNNNFVEITIAMIENDDRLCIILHNVSHFFMSHMLTQNVILDLLLFDSHSESDYFFHCCDILDIDPENFNFNKNTKIIYFEPSIGAEIACCFTDFSITTVTTATS